VDVDYQLIVLHTDTTDFWPLELGRACFTWHIEFGTFLTNDVDGTRTLSSFLISRQEMWLMDKTGPGGAVAVDPGLIRPARATGDGGCCATVGTSHRDPTRLGSTDAGGDDARAISRPPGPRRATGETDPLRSVPLGA
jgi:hypothetical protein